MTERTPRQPDRLELLTARFARRWHYPELARVPAQEIAAVMGGTLVFATLQVSIAVATAARPITRWARRLRRAARA